MGSAGSPVLIGGTGDDVLVGSRSRDLLIGGIGSAHLGAGIKSELVISGTSPYALGDAALQHILNQWSINQDPVAGVEGIRDNFDILSYDGGNGNNSLDAVLTQAHQSANALAVAAWDEPSGHR